MLIGDLVGQSQAEGARYNEKILGCSKQVSSCSHVRIAYFCDEVSIFSGRCRRLCCSLTAQAHAERENHTELRGFVWMAG